jgi:putative DNA primase/helicase
VSEVDRAVALSLLLTAIARPVLPAVPMHCVDSPEAGSGKSLLVDVASILASSVPASVMDFGRDAVVAGKRLDAMMLAGDPIIAIDNVEVPLEGAVLCQILTQAARRIRVLGTHRWSLSHACKW